MKWNNRPPPKPTSHQPAEKLGPHEWIKRFPPHPKSQSRSRSEQRWLARVSKSMGFTWCASD